MLASLVFAQGFSHRTVADTVKGLAALGYRYAPATTEDPLYGSLSHGGIKMDAVLRTEDARSPVTFLKLRAKLVLTDPISERAVSKEFKGFGTLDVASDRRREATVLASVSFGRAAKSQEVQSSLDSIWRDAARYAKVRNGRLHSPRDWNLAHPRYRPGEILDWADQDRIFDIVDSWGWPTVDWLNGGNPTDWKWGAFRLKGAIFMLLYGWDAKRPDLFFYATSRLDFSLGTETSRFLADQRKRLPGVKIKAQHGALQYLIPFDLSHGMTLKEIHRRFEAAAAAQAPLRKRYGATPEDIF